MRQIVLDTETTGLEPSDGHRIIEVGCVELINRRLTDNRFHYYLNPDREIDEGAIEDDLLAYLNDAELVIHNAPFDVGFIDAEYQRLDKKWKGLYQHCKVIDTLKLARKMHPGQKNNLDALCKRYEINNSHRELHGALLDAEILSDVYLAMTGGQATLGLGDEQADTTPTGEQKIQPVRTDRPALKVIRATPDEVSQHEQRLDALEKSSGGVPVWRRQAEPVEV